MADTETPHVQIFTAEMATRFEEIRKKIEERERRIQELKTELHQLRYSNSATDRERVQAIVAEQSTLEAENEEVKTEVERLIDLQKIQTGLDEARPYIELGREIARIAPAEIVDVLKIVADAGLDILEGMEEEFQRLGAFFAKQNYYKFTALVRAGFSEEQAMQILLAEIGRQSVLANAMTQAASATRNSKKK